MENKILNMKKIIIVILAFFTTSLVAQNTQDQQFCKDKSQITIMRELLKTRSAFNP